MLGVIFKYIEFFSRHNRLRFWAVVSISFIASLSEGCGIAMFLPLLQSGGNIFTPNDRMGRFVYDCFEFVGLRPELASILGLMVLFFMLKGVLRFVEVNLRGGMVADQGLRIRQELLSAYVGLKYDDFLSYSKGYLATLLTTQTQQSMTAFRAFCDFLVALAAALSYFLSALIINPSTALLGLTLSGSFAFFMKRFSRRTAVVSEEAARTETGFNDQLLQTLSAYKLLKSTENLLPVSQRALQGARNLANTQKHLARLDSVWQACAQPAIVCVIVTLIAADRIFVGNGIFLSLVSLLFIYRLLNTLMQVQWGWQAFSSSRGYLDSSIQSLETLKLKQEQPVGNPDLFIERSIELKDVSLQFENTEVLSSVSLKLKKNSFIALVGPSGSGKTTLMETLLGLRTPSSGVLVVDGNIRAWERLKGIRKRVGYVGQEPQLFNDTLRYNIRLSASSAGASDQELWQMLDFCGATDFIQALPQGLETPVGETGVQLSGGQKQRVALARELLRQPSFLFLDEPTSALDSISEGIVMKNLFHLKGKTTIVLITHRPALLEQCDDIFVLDSGQIVERGTYEQLSGNSDSVFSAILRGELTRRVSSGARVHPLPGTLALCRFLDTSETNAQIMDISTSGLRIDCSKMISQNTLPQKGRKLPAVIHLPGIQLNLNLEIIHVNGGTVGARFVDLSSENMKVVESYVSRCLEASIDSAFPKSSNAA